MIKYNDSINQHTDASDGMEKHGLTIQVVIIVIFVTWLSTSTVWINIIYTSDGIKNHGLTIKDVIMVIILIWLSALLVIINTNVTSDDISKQKTLIAALLWYDW